MPQGAKTLFFTFNELINIVLEPIPSLQLESSLLYKKITKNTTLFAFYIDNIFGTFKTYQEQYIFLRNHFFPCIIWSKLKLAFFKLKIRMIKIFALEKKHEIGGRVRLKPDKIKKILTWPIPKIKQQLKHFLGLFSLHVVRFLALLS